MRQLQEDRTSVAGLVFPFHLIRSAFPTVLGPFFMTSFNSDHSDKGGLEDIRAMPFPLGFFKKLFDSFIHIHKPRTLEILISILDLGEKKQPSS